ncbi:melanocyte-stimulating hormone receptor-like [Exaiptasia diaphana]|uniref:G-protein coupled receptors family 1 profile domain-containing protein n=1 Tax=Exaiptasia diaphana TaxID=2652724 RepID=A0A913YV02_EXADI|nr:melanocyte-stimulating hormone receptor-like [Exaiptasia diaphana]
MHSQDLDSHHGHATNHTSDEFPSRGVLIGWMLAFVLVGFTIFISNLGTILTFYKKKPLRRRGVYCLINLAVADMIHGFFSMLWFSIYLDYISIDFLPFKLTDNGIKLLAGLVNTCTLVNSLFCLLLVSLDRFYATFFPFAYRSTSVRAYWKVFAVTWSSAFLFSTVPAGFLEFNVYSHDLWFDNLHVVCLLCLSIIILAYIATFTKIRWQNRSQTQQNQPEEAVQKRERQEKHLAMTLLIVTALSLLTWLPFIINHEVDIAVNISSGPGKHHLELSTEFIQLLNSLVNPVVYLFRLKEYRRYMFQLLMCAKPTVVQNHDNGNGEYCTRRRTANDRPSAIADMVIAIEPERKHSVELASVH